MRNESAPALRGPGVRLNASAALQLPLHTKNESVRLWRLLAGLVCASLPNYRGADARIERFPTLAAELVRLQVDLIFAANTPAPLPPGKQPPLFQLLQR